MHVRRGRRGGRSIGGSLGFRFCRRTAGREEIGLLKDRKTECNASAGILLVKFDECESLLRTGRHVKPGIKALVTRGAAYTACASPDGESQFSSRTIAISSQFPYLGHAMQSFQTFERKVVCCHGLEAHLRKKAGSKRQREDLRRFFLFGPALDQRLGEERCPVPSAVSFRDAVARRINFSAVSLVSGCRPPQPTTLPSASATT